ncbi:aldo/keto reductase [Butyrivibrio sp. AE3004]|uniref:aldo/keto reductase n=1 Tax=Butyrivibrio sp. AE3004 TaxID=1506994 RepID=UPI000494D62A|nr:aldo/keto reductase [Butyrivibrio sp. AE3004]
MRDVKLGKTGIVVPQNGFGALPIQRDDMDTSISILRRAYDGGMRYFDTARAYSDSEEKLGNAFAGMREKIYIATKTAAKTPDQFWKDLETSLEKLQTDYIDVYQFHMVTQCWKPGDGSGMYECMEEAKKQGKIRHIGVTSHRIAVAMECVESGLYETMQFPFSYLADEKDIALVKKCEELDVGFIAMKGLAGGLITNSDAAMAFMLDYPNVVPIWGIQRMSELEEWLNFFEKEPAMTGEIKDFIKREQAELSGDFCRGCGYCLPCAAGIEINNCARMSLMIRRAPSAGWLSTKWQAKMAKIDDCINCGACMSRCPYGLKTPELLKKNLADYKRVISGEITV